MIGADSHLRDGTTSTAIVGGKCLSTDKAQSNCLALLLILRILPIAQLT